MQRRPWVLLVLALLMVRAYAIEAPGRIATEFNHTKWSARDGVPSGLEAVAQS
jgi:hypothetical protein